MSTLIAAIRAGKLDPAAVRLGDMQEAQKVCLGEAFRLAQVFHMVNAQVDVELEVVREVREVKID